MKKYFIIDFDSTFVQSEGLEELASVALKNNPKKNIVIQKIKEITRQGMEGKISFDKSLSRRLVLLKGNKLHIEEVVRILKKKISLSIQRNREFFKKNKERIYIVSGGFREFIEPIVSSFGIAKDHILANSFILDDKDRIINCDKKNSLAHVNGKVKAVESLGLEGDIYVIGDSYTDYQIRELGHAKKFIAFTENVRREVILDKADHVVENFDEFLYVVLEEK